MGPLRPKCNLDLRKKRIVVWDFKEKVGNSHGDGKANVW